MGTKRRFDARLLLAHVARLDKMVEELSLEAADDAARFDEILACIGGAQVPEHLEIEDQPLPLDRESAMLMAEDNARETARELCNERDAGKRRRQPTQEERHARQCEIAAAGTRARREAGEQWDAWLERACDEVDDLLGRPDSPPLPGLPGNPLPAPASAIENAGEQGPPLPFPRTVSDVSVSGLARALARVDRST